jgi:uncharacterized OsmC-like protein
MRREQVKAHIDQLGREMNLIAYGEAGMPVLTRVHVRYRVPVEPDKREAAERALARHIEKCPTAQTLKGAVEVTAEADWG